MTTNPSDITLELAQTVVDACIRRAAELDLKMNAAVVDVGANLKALTVWTVRGWAVSIFR